MHQESSQTRSGAIPNPKDLPRGWRWLGSVLLYLFSWRNFRQASRAERKRLPQLESTIAVLRKEIERARHLGLVHVERLHNVGLYLLLMDRDFSVLKLDMLRTFEEWRLKFTARQMALLLHEAGDDLSQWLGQELRTSLKELNVGEAEMNRFQEICKRLNQFKQMNRQFLFVEIRNMIAGHREKDAVRFMDTVERLDPMKVFSLAGVFFAIIHELVAFLIEMVGRAGQFDTVLKQLLSSSTFRASSNKLQIS